MRILTIVACLFTCLVSTSLYSEQGAEKEPQNIENAVRSDKQLRTLAAEWCLYRFLDPAYDATLHGSMEIYERIVQENLKENPELKADDIPAMTGIIERRAQSLSILRSWSPKIFDAVKRRSEELTANEAVIELQKTQEITP